MAKDLGGEQYGIDVNGTSEILNYPVANVGIRGRKTDFQQDDHAFRTADPGCSSTLTINSELIAQIFLEQSVGSLALLPRCAKTLMIELIGSEQGVTHAHDA